MEDKMAKGDICRDRTKIQIQYPNFASGARISRTILAFGSFEKMTIDSHSARFF